MAKKKDATSTLAEGMLTVLEAQRGLGKEAYPLTLQRLGELTDPQATPELVEKAVGKEPFKGRALVAQKKNPSAPVALVEDVEQLAASPLLLNLVLDQLCSETSPTCAPSKLTKKVDGRLKKPFAEAVAKQIRENTLPEKATTVPEAQSAAASPSSALETGRSFGQETTSSAGIAANARRRCLSSLAETTR